MSQTRKKHPHFYRGLTVIILICLVCFPQAPYLASEANSSLTDIDQAADSESFMMNTLGDYYRNVANEWSRQSIPDAQSEIVIYGKDYANAAENTALSVGSYGGKDEVLIWNHERQSWIEFTVDVPQEGLYELVLHYHSYTNEDEQVTNYRPTVLAVEVDGNYLFREARAITFPRQFKDQLPLRKDEFGDHIRPQPVEIKQWHELPFYDSDGSYAYPLKWHFTQGEHTIRLSGFEPIVIDHIKLRPPTTLASYAEVAAQYPQHEMSSAEMVTFEAEEVHAKNAVSLQMSSDKSAFMSPETEGNIIFNALGGNEWSIGGQMVTWSFTIPVSGRYKIGLRALNSWYSNKTSFRKIYIDGQVPFAELTAHPFRYSTGWQGIVLSDSKGEAYEFYLEAGEHTISLEVTNSPISSVLMDQQKVLEILYDVGRDINALIGGVEDFNRTWNIVDNYPEIPEKLSAAKEILQLMHDELLEANGEIDNNSKSLATSIKDIETMLDSPNEIPYEGDTLSIVQSKVGELRQNLIKQPLRIDRFYVVPANEEFPRMEASLWETVVVSVKNFFRSFNEESVLSQNDDQILNVWMAFGRDYVTMLQEMANQYFTPQTGIPVKVELLPREDLVVLANAAGKQPDVVIGFSEGKPVNFAMRDAALELSQMPGFEELTKHFPPGSMQPYYYDGGYYGVPETLQFKMLFYRKDILHHLGLEVPDTWEDVYDMLPVLQQNGYNFYIPYDFLTFFYQNGADFYSQDGMSSGLDSPQAYQAFRQMTELFSVYGIEEQVQSFYQRFRDGSIPIGFSDFNTYLELKVAAPELSGWWEMAPLPGVRNEDGIVERWSGGNLGALAQTLGGFGGSVPQSGGASQTSAMVFKNADNADWGWDFIKWWMSTETQMEFGSRLEGFFGVEFRWNTANMDAFVRMPWQAEELNPIIEQMAWYTSIVNVPGSYFFPRELNNAWNRTVVDGMNFRQSMEIANRNINRELRRKQQEFEFRDQEGNVIRYLDIPRLNKPWDEVYNYVRD